MLCNNHVIKVSVALASESAAVYLDGVVGHIPTRSPMLARRYSAYKAMVQVKAGKIILAFCWAGLGHG